MPSIIRNLALAMLLSACAAAPNAEPEPAPYLSGGVGRTSQQALVAAQDDYRLKLVFAEDGGAFLAEVAVDIRAADGTEVLTTTTDGPWLLVDLPAGEYRVTASYRGVAKEATVQVPATGLHQVTMRWQPAATGR